MSLRNRLRRLESTGSGPSEATCSECGFDPANPFTVEWEPAPTQAEIDELRDWHEAGMPSERMSDSSEEAEHTPQPEPCEKCGREEVVIDWHDAPSQRKLKRLEAEMMARRGWSLDALFSSGASQEAKHESQVPDYPPSNWSSSAGGPPNGRR